jgi:hypothetical protein
MDVRCLTTARELPQSAGSTQAVQGLLTFYRLKGRLEKTPGGTGAVSSWRFENPQVGGIKQTIFFLDFDPPSIASSLSVGAVADAIVSIAVRVTAKFAACVVGQCQSQSKRCFLY